MSRLLPPLLALGSSRTRLPACADAADMAKRKSGRWEIKTSHEDSPGMTMRICIDEKQDDLTARQADKLNQDVRKQCPKMNTGHSGDRIEIDSVCKFDKFTATGHTVISGKLSTQYTMEATTRFDPPMHGKARSHAILSGRRLGPCKPGQKHGAMSISWHAGRWRVQARPRIERPDAKGATAIRQVTRT